MDFDDVLEEIGEFGRYQFTNYMLLCLPVFFAAANSLSYVFTTGIPNYRCLTECDNINEPVYNQTWLEYAFPGDTDINDVFIPKQCEYYKLYENKTNIVNVTEEETCPAKWFTKTIERCDKWVYDKSEETIVEKWEITCLENQWKLALVGTVHFAGIVVGSGLFGVLADRYGRKIIFVFCIIFMSITGVGQGLSNNYITFMVFVFLNAIGTSGVFPLGFIIAVEMVGRKRREMSGIILNYFYALGEATVALIMWLCRDWVILQYIVSAPPILFIAYYWVVPESVRWLLAKKDNHTAGRIVRKAAKINGVVLSETILATFGDHSDESDNDLDKKELHKGSNVKIKNKHEILKTFKGVFTSRILLIRTLIFFYIWAANAFVYYGLSLNATSLSGNKYLNFALVCLVEIPGYSLAWILMNKVGRRWSLAGSLLLCAFTCMAGAFVTEGVTWALVTLFLIGKLGITSSFAVVYVHTAEMLPTIIRSGGVGTMSTFARFGAMIAPFVPLLANYMKSLPLILFSIVSFIGGLLALILPETLGKKLPDTIEEAELI